MLAQRELVPEGSATAKALQRILNTTTRSRDRHIRFPESLRII